MVALLIDPPKRPLVWSRWDWRWGLSSEEIAYSERWMKIDCSGHLALLKLKRKERTQD